MPPVGRRPAVVRGMDRALLTLLTHRPSIAPRLFPALFAHCPAHRLVRFLADRPNAGDLAAVVFATARGLCQAASGEPATGDVGNPPTRLPTLFRKSSSTSRAPMEIDFEAGVSQALPRAGSRKSADSLSGAVP